MRNLFSLLALCLIVSVSACSSSGSSNNDNITTQTTEGESNADIPSTDVPNDRLTGVFLDSAVSGLAFRAGIFEGVTNAKGEFFYQAGNELQLSIGDIQLPTVASGPVITPFDIFNTRNPESRAVQNLARLLQSLDIDGNPDNGIVISPEATLSATGLSLDFSADDFEDQVFNLVANSGSSSTALISAERAMNHLQQTITANGLDVIGCEGTHPLVGRTANFVGEFHDVAGTLSVVDDCTLEITEFSYDGGGPDVAFYGGRNREYTDEAGGVRLGPRLNGRVYDGETISLSLPDGITLDDIDSLSVWCFDVAVSFGDVYFGG